MSNSFSLDLFTDSYFQKDSKIHPNTELLIGKDIYAQISWDIREPGSKVKKIFLKTIDNSIMCFIFIENVPLRY